MLSLGYSQQNAKDTFLAEIMASSKAPPMILQNIQFWGSGRKEGIVVSRFGKFTKLIFSRSIGLPYFKFGKFAKIIFSANFSKFWLICSRCLFPDLRGPRRCKFSLFCLFFNQDNESLCGKRRENSLAVNELFLRRTDLPTDRSIVEIDFLCREIL